MKCLCALAILMMSILALALACSDDDTIIGPMNWVDVPGTSTILSIRDVSADSSVCVDPVQVRFLFYPEDSVVGARHPSVTWPDTGLLRITSGYLPNRGWVLEEGLTVGSVHSCIRHAVIPGVGISVLYNFPEVDYENGYDSCRAR